MFLELVTLIVSGAIPQVCAELCRGFGHYCEEPQKCCGATCCYPRNYHDAYHAFRWSVWNMWYFWFMVIFVLMSCFGGCGYWRRRQLMMNNSHSEPSSFAPWYGFGFGARQRRINGYGPSVTAAPINAPVIPTTSYEHPSYRSARAPSAAVPGVTIPQGAFPDPPPYTEVVSKREDYLPDKDDLPPYPGAPCHASYTQGGSEVPVSSLPSYSPPAYSANNNPDTSAQGRTT